MAAPTGDPGRVAAALAAGGVVAVPTDTVYGLACDPADHAAVERVYAVKRRPPGLELILLGADLAAVAGVAVVDGVAADLAAAFWPGALTLVVPAPARPRRLAVPRSGDTVGVRVPAHALLRDLLARTGPLATTSANRHGEPPCRTASEAAARLGGEVDAVLDGGPSAGVASTIIDCTLTPPRVLRPGPLTSTDLRPYLGG